jgi:glycolate oxidase iron-sulfur subunit
LFLIRALAEGTQTVNAPFIRHITLCLDCRNCETVCPSGVKYGQMLEAARGEIVAQQKISRGERFWHWLVMKQIFPYPARLNLLARVFGLYQRLGIQHAARATGVLRAFGRLGAMEGLLPETRQLREFRIPKMLARELDSRARSPSESNSENRAETGVQLLSQQRGNPEHRAETEVQLLSQQQGTSLRLPTSDFQLPNRVALFAGCIMRAGFAPIHAATIRVLEKNGWRVEVPDGQVCCGALHIHGGEREMAKDLARQNIDAFERGDYAAIVNNAAGCGAALKEYGELLRDDPRYAARAKEFAAKVKDVSELLVRAPLVPVAREIKTRVTYQEPCHLAHAQRIKQQPREILKHMRGVELVELKASDRCCGSAGIYNVLHPEIADELIDEKMANIQATGAEVVVTGNIGCLLQLEYGKRRSGWQGRVVHLVELLDEAYQSE